MYLTTLWCLWILSNSCLSCAIEPASTYEVTAAHTSIHLHVRYRPSTPIAVWPSIQWKHNHYNVVYCSIANGTLDQDGYVDDVTRHITTIFPTYANVTFDRVTGSLYLPDVTAANSGVYSVCIIEMAKSRYACCTSFYVTIISDPVPPTAATSTLLTELPDPSSSSLLQSPAACRPLTTKPTNEQKGRITYMYTYYFSVLSMIPIGFIVLVVVRCCNVCTIT